MKWRLSRVYTLELGAARIGVRVRDNGDARLSVHYGKESVWRYGAPQDIYARGWQMEFAIWSDEQLWRVLDALPGAIETIARERGFIR